MEKNKISWKPSLDKAYMSKNCADQREKFPPFFSLMTSWFLLILEPYFWVSLW